MGFNLDHPISDKWIAQTGRPSKNGLSLQNILNADETQPENQKHEAVVYVSA